MVFVVIAVAAFLALVLVAAVVLAVRGSLTQLRRQAGVEREFAVRAALEQAAILNQQFLSSQGAAQHADLGANKDAIVAGITAMQSEMGKELHRVTELVGQLQRDSASSLGAVQAQLRVHTETTQALSATTQSLREALASPKVRGQWGERMADDVLRLAGFVEHVNYEKQVSVEDGTGIPDFTFLLPKGHVLYMDVKFPLAAYLRYLDANTDAERSAQRAGFLRDVRLRIKELAGRQYSGGGRSAIGEVLLFIPNEAISGFIHEHDSALVDDALRQGIVLCSPLTLFALLAVIRQAYDTFMVERTSDEILRLLGAFNTQYERFSGALDLVGKRLESTQRAFDDLNGPRRRQLERPLGKIEELRTEKGLAIDPLTAAGAEVLDLEERRLGELGA